MMPMLLLSVCLLLTAAAVIAQVVVRKRQMRALARLAAEARLNYSATDHLNLGPRIAGKFPIAGAADLRAYDLLYGRIADQQHRFIFTLDFTDARRGYDRRRRHVCRLVEPHSDAPAVQPASDAQITLAPADLPRVEQYRFLIEESRV